MDKGVDRPKVVGFYRPGAKERIQEAAEAALEALFDCLKSHGELNDYEIEGVFCAILREHYAYVRSKHGPENAWERYQQFEAYVQENVRAYLKLESETKPDV